MKTLPCTLAILFILLNLSMIFAQEIPPIFPADESAQRPDLQEILKDKEFVRLYENMTGQKLPSEVPSEPIVPFSSDNVFPGMPLWPNMPTQSPPVTAMLQELPQGQTAFVLEQLNQLDRLKSVILNDLRNAETCGYHGVKLVPKISIADDQSAYAQIITMSYEIQTAVLPRRYVTTERNFDWAIEGDGFFVLRLPPKVSEHTGIKIGDEKIFFTRAGQFELTQDRKLVLKHGGEVYLLQPEIEIPEQSDATINPDKLQLAHFQFPERLQRIDGVIFTIVPGGEKPVLSAPNETSGSVIRTRQYEASNVNFAESLALYRTLHHMQTAMLDALTQ